MTIEAATNIATLNPLYPATGDSRTEGDDHIRLVKTCIQTLNASGGTAQIGYISASLGAVLQTLQAILRAFPVTPTMFGAVGNGVTDDTAALNLFHAAVSAGRAGDYQDKVYVFTAALTTLTSANVNLVGQGAILLYTGASVTPGNLMTISSSGLNNCNASGFTIASTTTLTAWYALRVVGFQHASIDVKFDGDEIYLGKLYGGLLLDGTSVVNLNRTRTFGCAIGIAAFNSIELHFNSAFVKGRSPASAANGIGVLIGGNCGGVYFEDFTQLLNNIGCKIDQSLVATQNQQIFFGTSTWDTNYTANVQVNDATANAVGKILDLQVAWFASCVAGNGFDVLAWGLNSKVKSSGASFINNFGDGLKFADTTVKYTEDLGTVNANNGGYGVNATGAMEIFSNCAPYTNTSGSYHKNITRRTPTEIQKTVTLASGANVALPDYSGVIQVANTSNGATASYQVGGGSVSLIGASNATFQATTTTPSAGTCSIAFTAGHYTLYSNFGSTQDYLVTIAVAREAV